jgi:excisionase family DNA binding protein
MTRSGYGSDKGPSLSFRQETDMPPGGGDPRQQGNPPMADHDLDAPEALLTPSEVAALFRVNPKTVTRWARAGKLTAIRTLGGHRRFRVSEIRRCLEEMSREEI